VTSSDGLAVEEGRPRAAGPRCAQRFRVCSRPLCRAGPRLTPGLGRAQVGWTASGPDGSSAHPNTGRCADRLDSRGRESLSVRAPERPAAFFCMWGGWEEWREGVGVRGAPRACSRASAVAPAGSLFWARSTQRCTGGQYRVTLCLEPPPTKTGADRQRPPATARAPAAAAPTPTHPNRPRYRPRQPRAMADDDIQDGARSVRERGGDGARAARRCGRSRARQPPRARCAAPPESDRGAPRRLRARPPPDSPADAARIPSLSLRRHRGLHLRQRHHLHVRRRHLPARLHRLWRARGQREGERGGVGLSVGNRASRGTARPLPRPQRRLFTLCRSTSRRARRGIWRWRPPSCRPRWTP
jgi:hypothetical protein